MIKLTEVSFSYPEGDKVLNEIDLEIAQGEFVAILGRNGSGKSTLARMLNGLLLPSSGRVIVDGLDTYDPVNRRLVKQKVGFLFPSPDDQIVSSIVEEDVAFGPANLGLDSEEIRQRVDLALRRLSMEEFAKHPPYLLSGGEKQKVCLAGLLAMKPGYLVLDEPVSMLDPLGQQEVLEALLDLNKNDAISLILITHNLQDTVLADKIIILDNGRITYQGTPAEILPQADMLSSSGIEPLEITMLIEGLNTAVGKKLIAPTFYLEDLVNILCPLK